MSSYNYKLYCETEGSLIYGITEDPENITTCPNDAGHTILLNSISIGRKIKKNVSIITTGKNNSSTRTYSSMDTTFTYDPNIMGQITNIKITGFLSTNSSNNPNNSNYSFRAYDLTNNFEIGSITLNNNLREANDIGVLTNLPTTHAIIEFQSKVALNKDKIYISSINIYYTDP